MIYGFDGKYHQPDEWFGLDGKYHQPGEWFGLDGKYHQPEPLVDPDGNMRPVSSSSNLDDKSHALETRLRIDGT